MIRLASDLGTAIFPRLPLKRPMNQYRKPAQATRPSLVDKRRLLDHPIFTVAAERPLKKEEVEIYLDVKARIKEFDNLVAPTRIEETLGAFDF